MIKNSFGYQFLVSNNSDPDFDANKDQISAPVLTPDPWCCTPAIAMIPKLPFFHGSDKYA